MPHTMLSLPDVLLYTIITMEKLFIVHGLKRSGNHAIINWIKAQERFYFFNNIIPIVPILAGRKTLPRPADFMSWLPKKYLAKRVPYGKSLMKTVFRRHIPFERFLMKLALDNRSLIVSLEDHELDVRPFLAASLPCPVYNILILRHPLNMFSSRIRKASLKKRPEIYPGEDGPFMQRVVQLWKNHAREFLGMTDNLENKVCILFDAWFSDVTYRQSLSRQLGLEFTDRAFSHVADTGLGSSFDGTSFSGNNQKMDVLNRKNYLSPTEQQLIERIFRDPELQDLAERIAGISHRNRTAF